MDDRSFNFGKLYIQQETEASSLQNEMTLKCHTEYCNHLLCTPQCSYTLHNFYSRV